MQINLPVFATRAAGTTQMFWKKNGATVLTSVGIAGIPVAMALTARATLKTNNDLPHVKKYVMEQTARFADKPEAEQKRAAVLMRVKASGHLAKYWIVPCTVAVASIGCLVLSHNMMQKREAELVGAFVALEAGFKAYRARVAERIGVEEEQELYRQPKTRAALSVDESDEGTACIIDMDDTQPSIYSMFFDDTCRGHSKSPEMNMAFLRGQERWANDKLRAQGHLFLNEVYDALGRQRTQAGNIVGWMFDQKHGGDGYVSFGIYQIADENNRAFVNGLEHVVGLDFNVDGVIIGKL